MRSFTPDRWQQIDRLFAEALERPGAERAAFLTQACGDDTELRREVEALLASSAEAESVLGESATCFAAPLLAALHGEWDDEERIRAAGQRLGPYRILEEVGRGGMGAVYLAERADDEFRQRVAIKLVKRGMDTDDVLRRFRAERQILAFLEHPHIARLYDGGASDDGRPYLVMEYIEGQPLTTYCDERRLGIDQRLALFQTVCQAVQYAHQNLVVHRDIKPSNILVTSEGVVKLLDFGIAKLLADDPQHGAPLTRTEARVLTPEYASPEQLRGGPVTTASDVYALGLVLYELLGGRRPYTLAGKGAIEAEREVLDREAEWPSAVVAWRGDDTVQKARGGRPSTPEAVAEARGTTVERLQRRLRGDLDTITLKALAKAPQRRYQSAEQLLEDIRRHVQGQPVVARRDTVAYRAAKFVRRHRAGVLAAALVLLSLVGGLSAALWQGRRAARELDVARQVSAFLEGLFEAPDPFAVEAERMDTLRVRDFLTQGAAKVQRELRAQPAVQARMLNVLGRVYQTLGLYDQAQPLLAQALRLRQRLHGATHPDVAESQTRLAVLLRDRGDLDAAEPLLGASLALLRGLHGNEHPHVAESLNEFAILLRARGRYDEAEQQHLEALRILRNTAGDSSPAAIAVLGDLVSTLDEKGDHEPAVRHARTALALSRSLYGDRHPRVAVALNDLALILQRLGKYAEAEALTRESLGIGELTLGSEHPRVADILNRLGSILYWQREYAAAESVHRRSLALKRKLYGPTHLQVTDAMYDLAQALREKGDLDAAEALNRESLAIVRRAMGDNHPVVAEYLTNLAATLEAKGDCRQAVPLLRDAIAGMRQTLSADRFRIPLAQRRLGSCLGAFGRYGEAESLLLDSYGAFREAFGDDDGRTGDVVLRLITLYTAWGKPEKAAEYRALLPDTAAAASK
jgi:serine/threonine protein kinase